MELTNLKAILEGITGYADKVVYYAWPEREAPQLPFICYLERQSNNFFADGITFAEIKAIDIELYTEKRSTAEEKKVEAALTSNGIPWEKAIDYIDDEKCWMITYTVEV